MLYLVALSLISPALLQQGGSNPELVKMLDSHYGYSSIVAIKDPLREMLAKSLGEGPMLAIGQPWIVTSLPLENLAPGAYADPLDKNYLVVEGFPSGLVPSSSHIRVSVFDRKGAVKAQSLLPTGWRNGLYGARELLVAELPRPIVEVQVTGGMNGRYLAREFFGVDKLRPVLLRLETAEGASLRNTYSSSLEHFRAGSAPVVRKPDVWAGMVCGDNAIQKLEALLWLAGSRSTGFEKPDNSAQAAVLERADVKAALAKLIQSEHKWMKEQAELVLKPWTDKRRPEP